MALFILISSHETNNYIVVQYSYSNELSMFRWSPSPPTHSLPKPQLLDLIVPVILHHHQSTGSSLVFLSLAAVSCVNFQISNLPHEFEKQETSFVFLVIWDPFVFIGYFHSINEIVSYTKIYIYTYLFKGNQLCVPFGSL